jgi:ribonucleoside-diphosphate reductase alpha chain
MIRKAAVKIDPSRDELFDELGLRRLRDSYMMPGEKSPQERFSYVARAFASNEDHAQRLYDYMSKHWLSASTPVLSYGRSKRGLPISCYLVYIPDTREGLVQSQSETNWLSMLGGGVGLGFGLRSEDHTSVGLMPHVKTYESNSMAYRQGSTRRGTFAGYVDISHPNVVQFMDMRKPTGDPNQRVQEMFNAVNIPDTFMQLIMGSMEDANFDDSWPLIDPHTKKVKEVVSAKRLWENLIETRMRTGTPYLHFIDASNRALPDYQKALGLSIKQSNICTEITLATDAERTAVCCLASGNLEYWEEWKDSYQFYRDCAEMLDNVLTSFIKKAPKHVARAVFSASQERAIGFGALGFHALLQKKNVPFESAVAVSINKKIFERYKTYMDQASFELAKERGPCPDAASAGVIERFSHKLAIAPNASTSIIMQNTSASIEPFRANGYKQDTLSGSFVNKNRFLDAILKKRLDNVSYERAWSVIIASGGSCQSLECLTDYEKAVYKTFSEVDQMWVIQHAADRQVFIDQAQSLNLAFRADAPIQYLHAVHFDAWLKGLKTLYYCRSDKLYYGESENNQRSDMQYNISTTLGEPSCLACE